MFECKCDSCKKACERKPGWFMPGEAEKTAELLGITLEALFKTKLGVDWRHADGYEIFVLSPAITNAETGSMFPANPIGTCVFFKDGLCEIHAAKPHECAVMTCSETKKEVGDEIHKNVAIAWEDHQDQIEDLLGEKPVSEKFSIFDMINMFGAI